MTIPGLESLQAASRYSLTLHVGRCFDQLEIAHQVVRLVLHAFYPHYLQEETPILLERKSKPATSLNTTEPQQSSR